MHVWVFAGSAASAVIDPNLLGDDSVLGAGLADDKRVRVGALWPEHGHFPVRSDLHPAIYTLGDAPSLRIVFIVC